MLRCKPLVPAVLFLALALSISCAMFIPGFLGREAAVYGRKSDNFITIWHIWSLSVGKIGFSESINFPFGRAVPMNPLDFTTILPAVWIASLTNELFAFNLMLALGFLLSAIFTYALMYSLTGCPISSTMCGLSYMILPYSIAMSQYHFTLARVEVFPFFLLALTRFLKRPVWYNACWIVIAQFFSFSVDAYYGFLNFFVLLVFLAVYLFYNPEKVWARPTIKRLSGLSLLVLSAAAVGIGRFLIVMQVREEFSLGKPFEQLYWYSAKAWDYFVPPAHHPVLGRLVRGFVEANIGNSFIHERTLYLGFTLLVLAVAGARRLRKSQRPEERFLGTFLPLVAIGAFLFSMPPRVQLIRVQIPMPGFFLYNVLPRFRVYSRFGVIVAMATIMLAGFGIMWVLERVKFRKTVTAALGGLIMFEFLPMPQYVNLSQPPAVYQWLADQHEVKAITEYPLCWPPKKVGDHLNLWDLYEYMLWQRVHKKPMFNGEPEKFLDLVLKYQLNNILDPNTPVRLGWLGITHIIVHKNGVSKEEVEMLRQNAMLEEVYSDKEAAVFRIMGNVAKLVPKDFLFPTNVIKGNFAEETAVVSPQHPGSEELVVFGPYMALYTGKYQITWKLARPGSDNVTARLAVVAKGGQKVLGERSCTLSQNVENVTFEFETGGDTDVEFRIYANGPIEFLGIELVQLMRGSIIFKKWFVS